jgi:AsmA protein
MLKATFPRIGLYGGQGDGILLVDASDAVPNLAMRINVNGVRALPLLTAMTGFDAIEGSMQAKIDVHSAGASQQAIMATLGGSSDILVQDGDIRGVNVAKMIRTLTDSTLTGWRKDDAEKTDLSQLSARFRISNGKATTDSLQLMGPLVRVSGAGTADIAEKTLQFKIDPKLVMTLEGQGGAAGPVGFGVPVIVQGTWSEPRIYPDIGGILENPGAAYDKLHALGQGLLGRSSPQAGAGIDTLMQGLGKLLGPPANDRTDSGRGSTGGSKGSGAQDRPAQTLDVLRDLFGR